MVPHFTGAMRLTHMFALDTGIRHEHDNRRGYRRDNSRACTIHTWAANEHVILNYVSHRFTTFMIANYPKSKLLEV